MKNKIFQWGLILLVLIPAFFSWFSVDRAIRIPDSSTWIVPMIWFSIFVIFLCLSAVLLQEKRTLFFTLIASFSFSLFFAFSFWHFLILLVSLLLASWGINSIRNDLGLNVKISLWKSLLTGKTQIIWALALLVSSQYFVAISSINGQKNMPKLDISGPVIKVVMPILGFLNPSFKSMSQEGLTVDQYLTKVQEGSDKTAGESFKVADGDSIDSQVPNDIPASQREILKQDLMKKISDTQKQLSQNSKELILAGLRKQFSQTIGQDLKGDEKMSQVLAGTIGQKMNSVLQTPMKGGGTIASMLPLVFSIILFLTIVPVGSWFLSPIWFVFIIMFFKILVKNGLVKIEKEIVQKESIQY